MHFKRSPTHRRKQKTANAQTTVHGDTTIFSWPISSRESYCNGYINKWNDRNDGVSERFRMCVYAYTFILGTMFFNHFMQKSESCSLLSSFSIIIRIQATTKNEHAMNCRWSELTIYWSHTHLFCEREKMANDISGFCNFNNLISKSTNQIFNPWTPLVAHKKQKDRLIKTSFFVTVFRYILHIKKISGEKKKINDRSVFNADLCSVEVSKM